MVENSSAGLAMLRPEVTITVTREEEHQRILARYPIAVGQERRLAVALTWCRISTGKHRGEHAIEVRLDGYRVGELTYLMSQRYGPVIGQVAARGDRPGCEAVLQHGPRGLELTLRVPRATEGAVPLPVAAPDQFGGTSAATSVLTPVPAPAPKRPGVFSSHKPAWIAAAVVLVAFFGAIGSMNKDDPAPSSAADRGVATTTTTTKPPVTTTTTTTTPPPTTTTTTVAPAPKPVVPQPVTPTQEAPAPPPPPPAAPSGCDPNYTGCVPIASDVDCAGGSGNGPAYASGPVNVIGSDIYDLDRDGNGVACE